MKLPVLAVLVFLLAGQAAGEDAEADSLIRVTVNDFMQALQAGDGVVASGMFSEEAMDQVDVMLETVKQGLNRDPENTMRHLTSVGYSVELEEAEDWKTEDYLSATLSLPTMSARYVPYELEIVTIMPDGRSAVADIVFRTESGVEIPQQAVLSYEDDVWKISSFMGITAFP